MASRSVLDMSNRIVVGGKYEVSRDSVLGVGGIATVYRGRDLRSRRDIAAKTLREQYQQLPEARRRFRQEARMMAFASHPGLVTIYDLIEQPDESWIVMELVPGRNIKQILHDDGPLPLREAVRILRQVSAALQHLHERKIIHLDIKPQNIIVLPDGNIKLIDFGLAQSIASKQDTIGGSAYGTAAYLSPEQGRGAAVDQRTDIYALGCVLYEIVTGLPPFDAPEGTDQKRAIIAQQINDDPLSPSEVRPDLQLPFWVSDVIGRAMEKNPEHRYQSVRAFADAAIAGLGGELDGPMDLTLAMEPVTPGERRIRFHRRRPPAQDADEEPRIDARLAFQQVADDFVAPTADGERIRPRITIPDWRTLRRRASQAFLVFAFLNVVMCAILLERGGPSELVEQFLNVAPGTNVEVAVDDLNVRTRAGADNPVITTLAAGEEVDVTGLSDSDEQGRWWPVRFEQDGETIEGWVWEGGLEPNAWTGRMSFMQGIADGADRTRDTVVDLWPW
jgi:predicted Ser/Thr protein kinase